MGVQPPRIEPLPIEDIDPETLERFGDSEMLNIFRTLAHHPKLLKRWSVFGSHILDKSTLPPREREIAILRTGWNSGSAYEFGQHTLIGRSVGLSDAEIERTTQEDLSGWATQDGTIVVAADELCMDSNISDSTWDRLRNHFDDQQILDLIFTVGQYQLVSMTLNGLRVPLDDGVPGFPEN